MIISMSMFLELTQLYTDMAKNGSNIYINLGNGTKLKLSKHE